MDQSVVISSLVVDLLPDRVQETALRMAALPGVEVHELLDAKAVVTIEAETVDVSHGVASQIQHLPGVLAANLVYVNFEDDPSIKGEE